MTPKTEAIEKPRVSWRKWIEPWYVVYAMLGAVIAGLIPISLPLRVDQDGNPSSAFNTSIRFAYSPDKVKNCPGAYDICCIHLG